MNQGRENLRAAGAERMAQRDGAAVDVDPRGIELELADAGDGLGGKGLVQLDQVELIDGQAGALRAPSGWRVWDRVPCSWDPPRPRRLPPRAPAARAPRLQGSAAGHGSAAAPSLIPLEFPAVTVRPPMNAGWQLGEPLRGDTGSRRLVPVHDLDLAVTPLSTGTISSAKTPAASAACARRWLSGGELVLLRRVIR